MQGFIFAFFGPFDKAEKRGKNAKPCEPLPKLAYQKIAAVNLAPAADVR